MPERVLVEYAIEDAGFWNQLDVYSITLLPEGITIERELRVSGEQILGPCSIQDPLFREVEELWELLRGLESCLKKVFGEDVVVEYKDWTGFGDI